MDYLFFGYKLLNQKHLKNSTIPKIKYRLRKKSNYHEAKLLSLNIEKAKKELNWKPRLKLDETIKLTVDWYKYYFENKNIERFTENQIEFYLNK